MINQGKISYSSVDTNNALDDYVEVVGSLTYDTSLIKISAVNLKYDEYNDRTNITIHFAPVMFTEKALKVLIHTVARLNVQLRTYWQVKVVADLDCALAELDRREQGRHSDDAPLEDEWSYEELTTPEEQEEDVSYLNTRLSYYEDENGLFFPDGKPVLYDNKGIVACNKSRIDTTRYRIDTIECVVNYLIDKEYKCLYTNA